MTEQDRLIEHARASVTGPWMTQPRDEWSWPIRPDLDRALNAEEPPRLSWWVVAGMCGAILWAPVAVAIVQVVR